ncbi:LytTR family DNA-binding domain-containing protein [Tenacibaculum tangerinum]|uniref:LytTR family DNA-binding domain-containing protein n=1 Tax=Tenacibaculum tangerinum TaxID=3038772 RepID=A0ABY8KZF1_9FLAO|nr:LytTR family DNA-binding domain-containing protein [Tenacibaculum tangerinum]WGH74607.1 LytTR family DNA-binding domain-containing protein [Tenacibaculum tangerinum]
MLKAVIVDDEPKAIQGLSWELSTFSDDIEIIETFTEAEKAIKYINENIIDCLFLDIEMPTMDGFQLLEKLQHKDFAIIITTAYNEYAIKALKNQAIDYLLKPIDSDDLKETIQRVKEYHNKDNTEKVEKILSSFNKKFNRRKITISTDGKLVFLSQEEILFVESDGNYSTIVTTGSNKKIVVTKKLKEIDSLLPDDHFFRIHNSFIINLNKIKEFLKSDGYVVLENNHKIPVSRQRKSDFLEKL